MQFHDKRVCTPAGLQHLQDRHDELSNTEPRNKKEEAEFFIVKRDLELAKQGKPVGTILHYDAKLSGLQMQALAIRSKNAAKYCGLITNWSDGYKHLGEAMPGSLLTRSQTKEGYNPYQYGAGEKATIKPIEAMGGKVDWKEWQEGYKTAFPSAYALRKFLSEVNKLMKGTSVFKYRTPNGFDAHITAIMTKSDTINTVLGKLEYNHKEIDADAMGVKIIAAFSHMLDATLLQRVVYNSNYDIDVVHDSFGCHPNDVDHMRQSYLNASREILTEPVLVNFVKDICPEAINYMGGIIANTLRPADIICGIY